MVDNLDDYGLARPVEALEQRLPNAQTARPGTTTTSSTSSTSSWRFSAEGTDPPGVVAPTRMHPVKGPTEIRKFDPLIDVEYEAIVAVLAHMVDAHQGWVNFEPDIPNDENIPSTGGMLSNKGPAVSFCTWTAPTVTRKGLVLPQSIGVQHALGGKARPELREHKLEVPPGWLVKVDHPKRGMVVELPADSDPARVVDWLLAAGEALATVPVTGRWYAAIHPG